MHKTKCDFTIPLSLWEKNDIPCSGKTVFRVSISFFYSVILHVGRQQLPNNCNHAVFQHAPLWRLWRLRTSQRSRCKLHQRLELVHPNLCPSPFTITSPTFFAGASNGVAQNEASPCTNHDEPNMKKNNSNHRIPLNTPTTSAVRSLFLLISSPGTL